VKEPIRRFAVDSSLAAKTLLLLWLFAVSPVWAAPEFEFRPPATPTDPGAGAIMSDLAARLIPVYQDTDPERYLGNLSALQMAAGDYACG